MMSKSVSNTTESQIDVHVRMQLQQPSLVMGSTLNTAGRVCLPIKKTCMSAFDLGQSHSIDNGMKW